MPIVAGVVALTAATDVLRAAAIPVPNASFESPATTFVETNMDSWQKSSKPDWYNEGAGFTWVSNSPASSKTHRPPVPITLPTATRAGGLAVRGAGGGTVPRLRLGGLERPVPDARLQCHLPNGQSLPTRHRRHLRRRRDAPQRDAGGQPVLPRCREQQGDRAATSITNTPGVFSNNAHLIDFQVQVPVVKVGDAWAGQHIEVVSIRWTRWASALCLQRLPVMSEEDVDRHQEGCSEGPINFPSTSFLRRRKLAGVNLIPVATVIRQVAQ